MVRPYRDEDSHRHIYGQLIVNLSPNEVSLIRIALREWKGKFPNDPSLAHDLDSYFYKKAKEAGWNPTNHDNE